MNEPEKITGNQLAAAWVRAFAEIEGAVKNAANPHYKSRFADLPAVIEAIKPHLVNHDLAVFQMPVPNERGIELETVLIHSSGEQMSLGQFFVPAAKNDPQGYGSATTYCRRFSLQTIFGLPAFDDDGEAARTAHQPAKSAVNWSPVINALREAATIGKESLKTEFNNHVDKPGFAEIWEEHKASLMTAAKAAGATE